MVQTAEALFLSQVTFYDFDYTRGESS